MAYFVLAGTADCTHFVHCMYIADYLHKHLPHFKYRSIQFNTGEWETWLVDINVNNGWFHTTSPLIWKEIYRCGGKPYLIGGISDFWEYVYDYYGLQSILPTETLRKLMQSNFSLFEETRALDKKKESMVRHIFIYGATDPIIPFLLPALNDTPRLGLSLGIHFVLYQPAITTEQEKYLETLIKDFKIINNNIELAYCVDSCISKVDLIIYTESYGRDDEKESDSSLMIQTFRMKQLGSLVNKIGKRSIKIIIADDGPVCFNANIALSASHFIRPNNIIAVTADRGFSRLRAAATHLQLPLSDLGAPPVWGSVGLAGAFEFVDIGSAVQCARVYRPYSRALRVGATSTLALGTVQTELRLLSYLTEGLDVEKIVRSREATIKHRLGRKQRLSKVKATVDVIKLWYAENETGEIISLGVPSNGSFDLPNGLFFSQPVMLQDNVWKPVSNFPIAEKTKEKIATLVPDALKRVEHYISK